jgi:hypothetical protein
MQDLPYSLMSELEKVTADGHPPVHLWHPENEKDIDLVVTREGVWNYLGTPIKRPRLVRLFASVLRKDGDEYFLVTPVEKCRITVEDVPFQVLLLDDEGEGQDQNLMVTTDMGESVPVDEAHPLRMAQEGDEWIPYVLIRNDMEARCNRNVYYHLAELMQQHDGSHGVWSNGHFYPFMAA